MMFDSSSRTSFDFITHLFLTNLKYLLRDDLSFTYLVGTKCDLPSSTPSAEDFAFNNDLLFQSISSLESRNIELVLKTLRTRSARLVSEMGKNLPNILKNL